MNTSDSNTTVSTTANTSVVSNFNQPSQEVSPPFFAVSLTKLFVMSICTFCIYNLYWFYKNWKFIKEQNKEFFYIMPFWRAFFAIIFSNSLFKQVAIEAKKLSLGNLQSGPLALGFIVFTLTNYLDEPYSFISLLSVIFLLPIQNSINKINSIKVPSHNTNSQFSAWNIVAVIIGGISLLLILLIIFVRKNN